ncbi:HPF/RaiA family ribosome-associated protein [Rosistilla oblonga]|uniref:HPF/RaiA family ribosome-associated protein n=1 Tax=Rosistilla oblonga TaxID=2527990 RepID=UPI003A96A49B
MPMQIHLVDESSNAELADYLRNRIASALGSLKHPLEYVEVELRDDPAQPDRMRVCDIDMKLFPRGWIYVNARSDDFHNAIDLAVARAGEVIKRTVVGEA